MSMLRSWALAPLLATALAASSPGQDRPAASDVRDNADMFSEGAIRKAARELARLDRDHGVTFRVVTVESLKGDGLDEVANRQAEQIGHPGILVLIAKQERKIEAVAAPRSLREELGSTRLHAIRDAFADEFKKRQVDEGLARGIEAASTALATIRPRKAQSDLDAGPASFAPEAKPTAVTAAKDSPLVLREQIRLTLAGARVAVAAAEARAAERGLRSNIAVVDDGGQLVAFARMDGARPASIGTATTKAISAATFRAATGPMLGGGKEPDLLLNLSLQNAAGDSGGKITSLLGGLPIVVDGQTLGAIGVAGGSGEQDLEIARAGLAALNAALETPKPAAKPAEADPRPKDAPKPNPDGPSAGEKPKDGADAPPR